MTKQTKHELEQELLHTVTDWQNKEFNQIQLNVYKKIYDNELYDLIESLDSHKMRKDFINDYSFDKTYEQFCEENTEHIEQEDLSREFVNLSQYSDDYYEYCNNDNYPMWNTLFELKNDFNAIIEAAKKVGCGIIRQGEYFNNTIFMMSAGHSLYASYWIPMYLEIFSDEAEKYKNINYQHL